MGKMSIDLIARKVARAAVPYSVRHVANTVPTPGLSIWKRLQLLDAVHRFAPELRLHPADKYRPSSVPRYLQNTRMRRHRPWWFDVKILDPFEVDVRSLVAQSSGGQHSGQGTRKTDFFVEIAVNVEETRRGLLSAAECYVHLRPASDGGPGWDIQYWFFYAYNGDITTGADFEHEGDWEHVTARVNNDLQSIREVFFHVHNDESQWRQPGDFLLVHGTHPVVYSAKHTHATYWGSGKQARDLLPDDHTADGGPAWQTWNALRLVGERELPAHNQEWINYTGHWGQIGTKISWLSGPYGPAFQRYWDNDS